MYLVERYVPEPAAASPKLAYEGDGIRHVISAVIPGDEISLSLFEAPSREELERALAAGGVSFIRIVEALVEGAEPSPLGEPGRIALAHTESQP